MTFLHQKRWGVIRRQIPDVFLVEGPKADDSWIPVECVNRQPVQVLAAASGCLNLPASLDLKDHASICLVFSARIGWLMERNFDRTFDDLQNCLLVNHFIKQGNWTAKRLEQTTLSFQSSAHLHLYPPQISPVFLKQNHHPPHGNPPECNRSDPVSPLKQHRIAKRSNHMTANINKKTSPEVSVCFSDSTKTPIFHGRCWLQWQ